MSDKKPFYITTTLPYLNASPHVGFAMEIIRADVVARYKEATGHEVFFNTGTDEHGQKIYQNAIDAGKTPQDFTDEIAEQFRGLKDKLGIWDGLTFIRTTDKHHESSAQIFWGRCLDNGYIYKKSYTGLYCVGCELFVTDKDLIDGNCPEHPGQKPIEVSEENYFFKFSAFQKPLLELYESRPDFVVPDFRFNEIKKFVEGGLQDFSISRVAEKMPWGVPVPRDDSQVMYVWFDALVNYISTLGWPEDNDTFEKFWTNGTPTQYAGKDNLRQQSAMWQAMLMAAGLPTSYQIVINGFINSGGHKMSKSLGNVINPYDIVEKYGTDALRYYLLRHVSAFEDSDVTMEKFHTLYTADLVNGIGNLTSRLLNMVEKYEVEYDADELLNDNTVSLEILRPMQDAFRHDRAMEEIWNNNVNVIDKNITEYEPFKKIKTEPETAKEFLIEQVKTLANISLMLQSYIPETAQKIADAIRAKKKPEEPLFGRVEE
ncbi:MAG: methionine--tRNA ligase [Candidatus Nomurabacteria bacterium]|nr:methionine--tRNA ligase [Candidatus Nomurabacteria bacterium]